MIELWHDFMGAFMLFMGGCWSLLVMFWPIFAGMFLIALLRVPREKTK